MRSLGQYLIEDGALTAAQLEAGLARQREMAARGEQKRLGEILLAMRLVSEQQLQRAIDRQHLERT